MTIVNTGLEARPPLTPPGRPLSAALRSARWATFHNLKARLKLSLPQVGVCRVSRVRAKRNALPVQQGFQQPCVRPRSPFATAHALCDNPASHTLLANPTHKPTPPAAPARPQPDFGPLVNCIGLPTEDASDPKGLGWYVELGQPAYPQNLYQGFKTSKSARVPA